MHEAGHPKLGLWDNPEMEWGGSGRGFPMGGHMGTCGWFTLMYGKSYRNIVIIPRLKQINFKNLQMDALTPEAIFTSVDIVLAGINQKPPALETSTSCSLLLWKGLLTSPASPQWGSSGLTFTTLDTRTERGAHGKHLSFRKVQMVLMACLTCVRNSVFDRRWSSMNLSRDLARVFLSSIMSLGTGEP